MEITVENKDGLQAVADTLLSLLHKGYRVILLEGELGAGKTTLTQMLCRQIGITEPVSSPTFSLVNEYTSPGHGTIYHMDLYRLEKSNDLVQIGFEEYLESGNICLIEWPDLARDQFTMRHVSIDIRVTPELTRIFNITTHDAVDA
ncbi:MAG: tRNA (adenosine(37)-N6)-threonylcarbamoyltransferase complex ATPase subunit type 1 TsaE [Saprospiraceae bacterium]|nr:tRNA (adenosine(37)-N6)-threonylcarbamoyltransferase complex ATPase subunit type 1 TsaE [Saprospiraceae bacterium]